MESYLSYINIYIFVLLFFKSFFAHSYDIKYSYLIQIICIQ